MSMSPQRDSHTIFTLQHISSYGKPSWKSDKYKLTSILVLIVLRQMFSVRRNYLTY